MELISLIGACLFIMIASLVGVVFVHKRFANWTTENIQYLVSFAAGVFAILSYNLVFEAFEHGGRFPIVLVSIIAGFLLFYISERIYPEVHCHHDDKKCVTTKSKRSARKVLIGDGIHNVVDGFLLVPLFMVDIKLGFIAAFGIFAHELVQEISEFFVLRSAGYTAREALTKNFAVSATILIGAVAGIYLTSFDHLVGTLIGIAAGSFLYILVIDLIPESVKHSHREKKYVKFAAWALVGVALALILNILIAHNIHEGHDEYHDAEVHEMHDGVDDDHEHGVRNEDTHV